MAATDSLNLINQSSGIHDVQIYINDFQIRNDIIKDITTTWGDISIYGTLTINDIYDVINTTKFVPNSELTIYLFDAYDTMYVRKFIILSSNERKEQDNKIITFYFRDNISLALDRTFIAKSYKETTLLQVIEDIFKETVDPLLSGFPIEKDFISSGIKYKNYCIPKNVSFLEFIINEVKKEGWFFYQSRNKIHFTNKGRIPKHKYPYKQVPPHDLYGFTIMSYRCKFNNTELTYKQPKTEYWAFDRTKKKMIRYTKSFDDYKESWKMQDVVSCSQDTFDERIQTQDQLIDVTEFNNLIFKKNTILEIVVPGNINYNLLWRDTFVELSGGKMSSTTQNDGDVKLSGLYSCFKIEDKIMFGNRFIQKMYLKRVDEGKK